MYSLRASAHAYLCACLSKNTVEKNSRLTAVFCSAGLQPSTIDPRTALSGDQLIQHVGNYIVLMSMDRRARDCGESGRR